MFYLSQWNVPQTLLNGFVANERKKTCYIVNFEKIEDSLPTVVGNSRRVRRLNKLIIRTDPHAPPSFGHFVVKERGEEMRKEENEE